LSCIFWKDGFKYGAFSYRLQGLNIGTIIGQSEIIARHAGLSTTIHHQFQDKVLNDLLGLDPLYESVYTVIEWRSTEVGKVDDGGDAQDPSLRSPTIIPEEQTQIRHVQDKAELVPTSTESIARWPLPEEIHRASLIETREAFRPLHSLAPIKSPYKEGETRNGEASSPLQFGVSTGTMPNCSGELASPTSLHHPHAFAPSCCCRSLPYAIICQGKLAHVKGLLR
jgi:hypothetical protein